MTEAAESFYLRIAERDVLSRSEIADYFIYFLTVEQKRPVASVPEIKRCYEACHLAPLARLPEYLRENSQGGKGKFLKSDGGYKLERSRREELALLLSAPAKIHAAGELRKLQDRLSEGSQKNFLKELIDCFEIGASRAAIVMCWILVLDVLYDFIFAKKLSSFNDALSKHPDKRLRAYIVKSKDDFSEISERNFITLCRSANIITNDVRKILDEKLGIRNSSAHPSAIIINPSKAIEFIEDLISNVVIKFSL